MSMPPHLSTHCFTMHLIEEVRKRRGLWSQLFPAKQQQRQVLWHEVAAAVEPTWDTLEEKATEEIVRNLQKRWRSIRDAYKRERRAQEEGQRGQHKTYMYYEHMRFLDEVVDQGHDNGTPKTPNPENQSPSKTNDNEQTKGSNLNDSPTFTVVHLAKAKKRKHDAEESSSKSGGPVPSDSDDTSSSHTTEELNEKTIYNNENESDIISDNSDTIFLVSFVPQMRSLPLKLKMWARTEIANVMQKAVVYNLSGEQPKMK